LNMVETPEPILDRIVTITAALALDGHRADIVMLKAARALASFRDLSTVTEAEVKDVAALALVHRQRRQPFEEVGSGRARLDQVLAEAEA